MNTVLLTVYIRHNLQGNCIILTMICTALPLDTPRKVSLLFASPIPPKVLSHAGL